VVAVRKPVVFVCVLGLLMMQAWALLPDPTRIAAHVIEKRGDTNLDKTIRCNQDPDAELWFNPVTDRYAKLCNIDGTWFIVILLSVGVILTGIPKEKLKRKDQVEKYLANRDYERWN